MYEFLLDQHQYDEELRSKIEECLSVSEKNKIISEKELLNIFCVRVNMPNEESDRIGWNYDSIKNIRITNVPQDNVLKVSLPEPVKIIKTTDENTIVSKSILDPPYYIEGRKYEPRKVIADWGLSFNLGNAVKYISRGGRKKTSTKVEDLMKAIHYIEFEIEEIEKMEKENDDDKGRTI